MPQSSITGLRTRIRRKRRRLATATQISHSESVHRLLAQMYGFKVKRRVACYIANDGELDLNPTMKWLTNDGHDVVLPFLQDKNMHFAQYNEKSKLGAGKFGLLEPVEKISVAVCSIEVVLAPMVAFDDSGNRVGRGGGYYDRFMSDNASGVFIGVGHELQKVEQLSPNVWDKRLDASVTENSIRTFTPAGLKFVSG